MENKNFRHSISVNISAIDVTRKISNIPEWWGISFNGKSEKVNDTFIIKMGGASYFNMTVTEFIPGKKIVWFISDCFMPWYEDKKEWVNAKLIFDLDEKNGSTTINFIHEGLTPALQCYNDCQLGWQHWIGTSLFSYLTTGKGQFKKRIPIVYTVSIEIAKPASEVFHHLLLDVAKFWPEDFEGNSAILNDEFVFTTGDMHYSKSNVVALVPNQKIVWLVTDSIRKTDNFNWTGTKMIFELSPIGKNTLLNYSYDGYVLENEVERLKQVCDLVIKDMLYNLIVHGKTKPGADAVSQ